ncbi:hypothetical protein [Marinivivus vitaminiproducens]|uniref:hypothetical protein n=1 Tax=Marinivivus vitaminiproducens TaxID=3035935 RepID=UPI0027994F7C|nr:hypothetical protein P4R82_14390 [Geminicoccaceae bacterium SCSIO 64248]
MPRSDILVAIAMVAGAVLYRLPVALYSVINTDESLYLLIGEQFAHGMLPYTGLWDRKPFGLFALFAVFAAAPFDGVVASRVGASIAVGVTAWLLVPIARRLFVADGTRIGIVAGIALILSSPANGGWPSNAELFHTAFAVAGLAAALRGFADPERPSLGWIVLAGLCLGVGIQIKTTVVFDLLAFGPGFLLLTTPALAALPRHVLHSLRPLALLGVTILLPTLLVLVLYLAAGQFDAWLQANVTAVGYTPEDYVGRTFGPSDLIMRVYEQAPVWAASVLALVLAHRLIDRSDEARSIAFLALWFAAVMLGQIVLRMGFDHYFLQFLPPLGLLTGVVLVRGLEPCIAEGRARVVVLVLLAGLTGYAMAGKAWMNALFTVRERLDGVAWSGDIPRQIAGDLNPVLQQGDGVYVFDHEPILYYLTGTPPPSRFAMPNFLLVTDSYGMIDGSEEIRRILDACPRFIVARAEAHDAASPTQAKPEALAMLQARLADGYVQRGLYERNWRDFVLPLQALSGAAIPAVVYERTAKGACQALPVVE